MTSPAFSRARTDAQRRERREAILSAAADMLRTTRVADLSLNALARRVGLAKSNVLRYFESREAVLLELYAREYASWLDALEERLGAPRGLPATEDDQPATDNGRLATEDDRPATDDHLPETDNHLPETDDHQPETDNHQLETDDHQLETDADADADDGIERVSSAIAETVTGRDVFCDLCASAPGVLEHNVSLRVAESYKRDALALARRLGELVGPVIGGFTDPGALAFVGVVNLAIGGIWAMSKPSPGIAAAYAANPELRTFQLDFRTSVREVVATVLVGLRYRDPRT